MSHKATQCLNRLAAAAAMSLACAAAHAEAPLLNASIKLSNLSFQLIDLDPNDGIAPSLTVANSAKLVAQPFETFALGEGNDTQTTALPLAIWPVAGSPLVDFSTQSSGVGLSTTANSLSLQTALTSSGLVNKPTVVNSFTYESGAQLATNTYRTDTSGGGNEGVLTLQGSRQPDWNEVAVYSAKLSANTALIITGQAAVDLHMDRTMLDAAYQQLLAGYENPELGATIDTYALTRASVSLALYGNNSQGASGGGFSTYQGSYSSSDFTLASEVSASAMRGIEAYDPNTGETTYIDGDTFDVNKQRSFSVVSFNNTGLDMDLSLDLQAQVTAMQVAQRYLETVTYTDNPNYQPPELPPLPTPDHVIPSIPEPSTYALMGLGLVGIVLARRRLRPTQAA